MNWYIGQEVLCIKPVDDLKKGKLYVIQGLIKGNCPCHDILIDIGYSINAKRITCVKCLKRDIEINYIRYYADNRFTPLEYDSEAISELLEQTKVNTL